MYKDRIEHEFEAAKSIVAWKACMLSMLFAGKTITFQIKNVSDDSHKIPLFFYEEGQVNPIIFIPIVRNEIQGFIDRKAIDSPDIARQVANCMLN